MTADDAVDAGGDGVERLVTLSPDAGRAARTRERCHAQLRKRRRRSASSSAIGTYAWRVVGPVVVGGICLLYAASLAATMIGLERL